MKLFLLFAFGIFCVHANTECFWVVGKVECSLDQHTVIGTRVEAWDYDGPEDNYKFIPEEMRSFWQKLRVGLDRIDPDDKVAVEVIGDENGEFYINGCASDPDWTKLWHSKNTPEFYLRIYHNCTDSGQIVRLNTPVVKVFAPTTYDAYYSNPIQLYAN